MKIDHSLPLLLLLAVTTLPALAHADPIYVYGMAQSSDSGACYVSDSVIARPELESNTSQEYFDQIEEERKRWRRALDRQGITDTSTNGRRIVDRNRLGRDDAEDDRRTHVHGSTYSKACVVVQW